MNQGLPVIATDAVGAAAGGLVRDGATASSCRPATPPRSPRAIRRLHDDPALRARLGAAGREDVARLHLEAWAAGFAARPRRRDRRGGC